MPLGTVEWFNESKGLGSIRIEGGTEIPVHYSAIQGDGFRTLLRGEEVRLEIRETDRGPEAANLVRN